MGIGNASGAWFMNEAFAAGRKALDVYTGMIWKGEVEGKVRT